MILTIIYSIIILLPGLLIRNKDPKQRLVYIIFVGLILILISGFRNIYFGTDDTSIYYLFFERDSGRTFAEIWNSEEKDPVYFIFIKCLSYVFPHDFNGVLLVCAAIFVIPACILIYKESSDPFASFVVLLSMGYFFFSMNGIRQSLSLGFLMLAYFPLKNRKLLKFIVLVAIAACFHKTSLIFLIVYPLSLLGFNFTTICCYLFLFVFSLLYGEDILNTITTNVAKYDTRFSYYELKRVTLTYSGLIQLILLTAFSFFYRKKLLKQDNSNKILFHLMLIAIIFQSLAAQIAEMFRIAMYFSIFIIILIPNTLSVISENNRKSTKFVLLSLLLIYYFFMGTGTIPYMFSFQQI